MAAPPATTGAGTAGGRERRRRGVDCGRVDRAESQAERPLIVHRARAGCRPRKRRSAARRRCVVLTGGPEVFSAGADLSKMTGYDPEPPSTTTTRAGEFTSSWRLFHNRASAPSADTALAAGWSSPSPPTSASPTTPPSSGYPRSASAYCRAQGAPFASYGRSGRQRPRARARPATVWGCRGAQPRPCHEKWCPTGGAIAGGRLARQLSLCRPLLSGFLARRAIDAATESSRDVALLVEQLAYAALSSGPGAEPVAPGEHAAPAQPDPFRRPGDPEP